MDVTDLQDLLSRGDLHGALDALTPLLPGAPGHATHLNVLSGLRVYLRWIEETGHSVVNADHAQAQAYSAWLAAQYAPATHKNRLTQVRTLYDLLQEQGLVEGNPFRGVQGALNRPHDHRQAYPPDDVDRLLAEANLEERTLVLLGAHGGLTGPEVLGLTFEAIDLALGQLKLPSRTVQASEALMGALERWGHQRGHTALFSATGPVFDYATAFHLRKKLYFLCQRADVTYRAWHALRHAAGLRLLTQVPVLTPHTRQTIQQILGLNSRESLRPLLTLSGRTRPRRR
ncbi:integrase (plasmid) [Deinococcus taeanensis]|uniref:tyrosine-type recombinase/integrase n=1 Tax=Deinococcus taeanensis TaxID=2737050 RepID=UPI001CDD0467|nr:integrase [Deinococcus taeanensis]UBV45549.1 integrase [Deinococcus taeanensis]